MSDATASTPAAAVRLRHRAVAEREAGRLARPDRSFGASTLGHASRLKSAVQSTPFGSGAESFSRKRKVEGSGGDGDWDVDEVEEWCGPFSVARQMIAAREAAREKREAQQKEREGGNAEHHPLDAMMEEAELEKQRKENPSMTWVGKYRRDDDGRQNYYVKRRRRLARQQERMGRGGLGKVPTLFRMCVDFLVERFDDVEALGQVDNSIRRSVCEELVAKGKMNGAAFDAIAEVGIEALELVDCAEVTQDQLSHALKSLMPAGLRALLLNHAGRCFGSKTVDAIVSCPDVSLFAISLGGAYLLKDCDAASLVKATASTLSSVEISACPSVGSKFCTSIVNSFSSSGHGCLLELSLADLNLTKESLLAMGAPMDALRNLKSLSLKQIESVDDDVVSALLDGVGDSLEGINLSNNLQLTDETLSNIRRCNVDGKLRALELSGLKNLTAAGLEAFFTHGIPGLPSPPMLRKLDLSSCDQSAVNDTVIELAARSSSMKRADALPSTTSSTGLSAMGGLVHLNISGSCVTDKSMENLASTCFSSLEEMDVSFCCSVSDKGLGYFVSKAEEQFSKLHIWGCAQITDEFLDGHDRVDDGGLEIVGVWMKKSGGRSVR